MSTVPPNPPEPMAKPVAGAAHAGVKWALAIAVILLALGVILWLTAQRTHAGFAGSGPQAIPHSKTGS